MIQDKKTMDNTSKKTNITVLLPAGRLPLPILDKIQELSHDFGLELYCSTAQNIRLLNVNEDDAETIKGELAALGAAFKKPGVFPLPRVCIGTPHCKLGLIDIKKLSDTILTHFKGRSVKPKIKIAIAACPANCTNAISTDIGIVATKAGLDLYAGGKGGAIPKTGRRLIKHGDEKSIIETIEKLLNFHDSHTTKKQRMAKLLNHPDFPYPEAA